MRVPPTAIAATRQLHALAQFCQIANHRLLIFIKNLGAYGHTQDDVVAILTGALFTHAGLAVLGEEVLLVTEIDQRIEPVHRLGPNRAARTAIAAVRATIFNVFLAPKRHAAASTATGSDVDFAQVEKLHGLAFQAR